MTIGKNRLDFSSGKHSIKIIGNRIPDCGVLCSLYFTGGKNIPQSDLMPDQEFIFLRDCIQFILLKEICQNEPETVLWMAVIKIELS